MKRKLDLNEPGIKLLYGIGVLIFIIPALLYGLSYLLDFLNIQHAVLSLLIKGSILAGIGLFAILILLLIIEGVQDRRYDLWYQKNRKKKIKLSETAYECQYCGNQKVGEFERFCRVCGKELE